MGDLTTWPTTGAGNRAAAAAGAAAAGAAHGSGLHRGSNVLLHHGATALDDTDLAFGFGDLQFRHIRFGHQINQGLEFSQIHGSSNG
jgi:hypothetical protein